eukprot:2021822-Pleurochrysis_carterae.AAC.1
MCEYRCGNVGVLKEKRWLVDATAEIRMCASLRDNEAEPAQGGAAHRKQICPRCYWKGLEFGNRERFREVSFSMGRRDGLHAQGTTEPLRTGKNQRGQLATSSVT